MQHDLEQARAELRAATARMESNHGRTIALQKRVDRAGRDLAADEQRQIDSSISAFDAAEADARAAQDRINALESQPLPRQAAPNPIARSGATTRDFPPRRSASARPTFQTCSPDSSWLIPTPGVSILSGSSRLPLRWGAATRD